MLARDEGEDRAPPRSRRRLTGVLYGVGAGVYLLDRLTKLLVERKLHRPLTLVPGILQLQYTENRGGAFGLFGGATWLFLTATLIVTFVIVLASLRLPRGVLAVALGMVLGGALGNLTDRLVRGPGLSGRVIDFLAIAREPDGRPLWPVFNLADSAIVVGAALIVIGTLRRRDEPEAGAPEDPRA